MAEAARLRLLGPPEGERENRILRGFESRKALALLCFLAARGRTTGRRQLAAVFWTDKAEARGRGNLSRVLHNISGLLPECLEGDRETVRLRPGSLWLDIDAFEQLEAEGDPRSLAKAAELYRGEFLEGIDVDDSPEFEIWLDLQREHWRRRASTVLERLAQHHAHRGEHAQAVTYASRLLELQPLQEEIHRLLMLSLARSGQHAAALGQYQRCRRILGRHLDIEPAPATTALYRRIQAATSSPRHSLPLATTPFVGREEELSEVARLLAGPHSRLLTLHGPGGIGKTRLALEAASRSLPGYLDGAYFVSLRAIGDVPSLVSALATEMSLSLHAQAGSRDQVLDYLAEKDVLLVLDSVERLDKDCLDLINAVLHRAQGVRLLATSRQRLGLQAEWILEVEGLRYPRPGAAASCEQYGAVKLFLDTVERLCSGFEPTGEDRQAIVRICNMVEGMPLAIELAAARIRALSCREIVFETEHNPTFLAAPLADLPEHQRSIRAAFEDSWRLLSGEERAVFSRLSVFSGGFTGEAAERVAGGSHDIVASLFDKSFVRKDGFGRYQIHDLLQQFGSEKLAERSGRPAPTHDSHSEYYLHFLSEQERHLRERHAEAMRAIGTEIDNVRAAWAWAVKRRRASALAGASQALFMFLEDKCLYEEGVRIFRSAVTTLERRSGRSRGRRTDERLTLGTVLANLGWFLYRTARVEDAIQALDRALELLRSSASPHVLGFALVHRGAVSWLTGAPEEARRLLAESLALAREGRAWYHAIAASLLGFVEHSLGELTRARELLHEAYRSTLGTDDTRWRPFALLGLARVATTLREFDDARTLCRQSLDGFRATNTRFSIAIALADLAALSRQLRDYPEAERSYEEALYVFMELGERWGISRCLCGLGVVAYDTGRFGVAATRIAEGLTLAMQVEALVVVMETLVCLSGRFARAGERALANDLLGLALAHPATDEQTSQAARDLVAELRLEPASGRPSSRGGRSIVDMVDEALCALAARAHNKPSRGTT